MVSPPLSVYCAPNHAVPIIFRHLLTRSHIAIIIIFSRWPHFHCTQSAFSIISSFVFNVNMDMVATSPGRAVTPSSHGNSFTFRATNTTDTKNPDVFYKSTIRTRTVKILRISCFEHVTGSN